ncbi:hypothetical protein [Rhodopseudomonas pseudopalustris]|uniref:Uncharacterized protein n=1 Tax=Rhodopseudomonas pseudopalustris TaxID=1513892 RepID=A0A1H8V942_9BRAD|nr:hypothetical protein [Rhodopseudomonas pseudopalustris]SEP11972.1 hypothetical protein SAMN05444123_108138 [Rhodopseudomonas pseudopalustris]
MNAASTFVPWGFLERCSAFGAEIIVAADGRQIGVLYSNAINPQAKQDHKLAVAAPELRAALTELTAAFDDALSATDVAGAMYSARVNAAREAAEAALAATRIVEPRR